MKKNLFLLLVVILIGAMSAQAQGRRGLRINEVMVQNDSSVTDEYGQHHAWIELFNSTFAPLEISSVYLTTSKDNPKMYPVPLGDVNTKMPKRQHVVFWADGNPTLGTFHTNFVLVPEQENWIGVFDADGRTLIDSVTVPAVLAGNQSYARIVDGVNTADGKQLGAAAWEVRDDTPGKPVTPSSANQIRESNDKIEMFAERDKNGFAMAIMAMGVVFSALLLLCLCFYGISRIGASATSRNKAKTHGVSTKELAEEHRNDSGEAIAAIAMALHEHLDAHDRENTVLTINKVKRAYSPWNSKIYNMRHIPNK